MIKTIIKRDGRKEDFNSEKLNGWGIWAAEALGKSVNWGDIILTAVSTLPETTTAEQLQDALIDTCLSKRTWAYNRMAGRLFASTIYKIAYENTRLDIDGSGIPHIKDLHQLMLKKGILDKDFVRGWTEEEYDVINKTIKHQLDLTYPYYQIKQINDKYSLKDRTKKNSLFETPQFVYMRVAMRMAMNKENRMEHIKKFYKYFSENKINIPTPYFTNAGTSKNGYNSCCVYKTNDTVGSLAAGDHIAYTMTYSSAGIGAYIQTRPEGSPIRGGIISHRGKLSYYRALVGAIQANMQNGRGGAATVTYDAYDPEVFTIQPLKNALTPVSKQVRGVDYSMAFNRFFAQKAAKNEEIALFDIAKAPEIYEALVSGNEEEFERVYEDAVAKKKYNKMVSARQVVLGALTEAIETGRHYYTNLTEMNSHTPFKDPIYQSNLCQEIAIPTKGYESAGDLYQTDESIDGEVGLCSLASIVISNITSDEEYSDVAYYCLLMIHTAIHESDYVLPHIETTAKARNSAGVGMAGLAHYLAKQKLEYNSVEGFKKIHEVSETHYYHLVKASLRMSKDYGNAKWIHKTKWPEGWLPIDTYNKNVDTIAEFENKRDWESLRSEVIENGGIHNSVLVAEMPQESSSLSSGTTNGLYPIRNSYLIKTNDENAIMYVVPEYEKYSKYYQIAWDIPSVDMIKVYGIVQKWTDQGISGDLWKVVQGADKLSSTELLKDFFASVKYGMKSRYYINSKTAKDIDLNITEADCEGCSI